MAVYENKSFANTTIVMDWNTFRNCRFTKCTIVYKGGKFGWENTHFEDCIIDFQDVARNVVDFMRQFGLVNDVMSVPKGKLQ